MNIVSETTDISHLGAEAERGKPIPWLERLNDIVGMLVEFPAALLVAAEVVVLLMGVIWRYVLHTPLVWSDELASILFLWLAMLGSIVALRRGEHMRMTAIVGKLPPHLRAFLDLIAIAAALAFLLFVVRPAYEFAEDEMFVTTPSLEIANSWRAAALPIGIALMILVGFIQIFRFGRFGASILALGTVAAAVAIIALLGPYLQGLGNWNLLIFFVLGVGSMVLLGVPIAFSFGLATFAYLALTTSTPTVVVVGRMDEGMSHLILLAVPLFVLLGLLIEMTGMARAMVGFFANSWSCPRRALLRPDRRDVPRLRNSGLEGRRHGSYRPSPFPGDEAARREARRARRTACSHRCPDGDDPAFARANHHRLRNRCLNSGALYRWAAAGGRARADSGGTGLVALP